ncbi:MAG: ComEC/Rec2 family competence protein [candidate division WOR-3 bacterium]
MTRHSHVDIEVDLFDPTTKLERVFRLETRFYTMSFGMRHAAMRALVAVALGIGLSRTLMLPVWVPLVAALLGLGLARISRGLALYLALVGAAYLYAEARRAVPAAPETFRVKQFRGVVVDEPGYRSGLRYSVALLAPLNGKVMLWLRDSLVRLRYGDVVEVAAPVRRLDFPRNPGLPDFNRILAERGVVGKTVVRSAGVRVVGHGRVSPWMGYVVMPVRRYIIRTIEQLMPEPEAALLAGLLLAHRQVLSEETRQAFTDSGIVHIFAVSGLHMGIVVYALLLLLGAIGVRGWWRFSIGAAVVLLYAAVAGFSAAPARAGIMALAALLSVPVQRRVSPSATLASAGLVLLLADPSTLFEVGAQLSFAATLGIVLVVPRLEKIPANTQIEQRLKHWLFAPAAVSLAATLATAPLMLHHFFRVQPLAFLTSLVAALLVSLALPLGFVVLLANLVHGWLASVFAGALWALLWLLHKLTLLMGELRWAIIEPGRLSWLGVAWAYAVMLAVFNWSRRAGRFVAALLLLAGLNVLVWTSGLRRPQTQVVFLDPRQGDATLLEDTLGRHVLIDAGIDRTRVLRDYLLSRGIHHLDAVVITHPDRDHYGGLLDLPKRCRIEKVLVLRVENADSDYARVLGLLRNQGSQIVPVGQGSRLTGCGFGIEFLWPDEHARQRFATGQASTNEVSLVARVEHSGFVMLLTGDRERLELLPGPSLRADLLKSPHHGSRKGNRPELYRLVQPDYVVVMGRYPTPARLETRLARTEVQYVNTRAEGGVVVRLEHGRPEFVRYQ